MYRVYTLFETWRLQIITCLTFGILSVSGNSQQISPFQAPVANPLEARVGSIVAVDAEKLRLDIGASITFHEICKDTSSGWLTLGADFMTYTRLRSENNFKFPVETSDYFFGVNAQYRLADTAVQFRARIAHISSHLVDGYANSSGIFDKQLPFVYSREFLEVSAAYSFDWIRPYITLTALWATQPRSVDRLIPEFGVDIRYDLGKGYSIYGGYDCKYAGIYGVWVTSQAAQLGVFAKILREHGLLLSVYSMSGRSMHGMFFNQSEQYWGIGFQIM